MTIEDLIRGAVRDELRTVVREEVRAAVEGIHGPPVVGEFVSVKDAAKIAGVNPATVRAWIHRGALGQFGGGRVIRVKVSELHTYLGRQTGKPSSEDEVEQRAQDILSKNRSK